MQKRRLLKLAALLEADAKNKKGIQFDLGTWGQGNMAPGLNCGTTACAMGLAALSGVFRYAGLRKEIIKFDGESDWEIMVRCKGGTGLEAACNLFDIGYGDAGWLFYPDSYEGETPQGAKGELRVAKRIRDFVAEN